MYLSRVEIDTHNRQKMKDLSHLGAYHNWVEQSFPNEVDNGKRLRHLWRIDRLNGHDYLLVLSAGRPNPNHLATYGVPGSVGVKDYDHFLDQLTAGMVVQFRLTANPSYRDKEAGRVYPHITVAQQKGWLSQRADKNGFQFVNTDADQPSFDIVSRDWCVLYHSHRRVKLSRVSFEGILKITDLAKFKKALTEGIGREKAYGMGLLTVIPERR